MGRAASPPVPNSWPAGLRVLVVLASRQAQDNLLDLLKDLRYSVTVCQSCRDAASRLAAHEGFELIIAEASVLTSVQQEQDLQAAASHVPLILLSDKPDSPQRVWQGLDVGAAEVLERPVASSKLRNLWQHVVRRRLSTGEGVKQKPATLRTLIKGGCGQPLSPASSGPFSYAQAMDTEHSAAGSLDRADSCSPRADQGGSPTKRARTGHFVSAPSHVPGTPSGHPMPVWNARLMGNMLPHQAPHPVPGCVWGTPLNPTSQPAAQPGTAGTAAWLGSAKPPAVLPGGCCMPAAAMQAARCNMTVLGSSRMIPINEECPAEEVSLPTGAQTLPPIGLALRKSASLLDLVNQHLACVQAQ